MAKEPYLRLEEEFGKWAGVENVVACNSGTAALHLALEAFRLPQGSEVILPDYTMVACARAVTMAGLKPVFIDCDPRTLLLNPALLEQCVTDKTRVVMAVHVYGRMCNMPAVIDFANKYDLHIIEDLAEAHGIPPYPGTDAACWSFYKNKVIAGEEGGAVAFRHSSDAHHARQLRSVGFTAAHDYTHVPRGHNYRLANLLADPILVSLYSVDYNLGERRRVELTYNQMCPAEWRMPYRDVPWVYDFRVQGMNPSTQREVVEGLRAGGIAARYGFKPMTTQKEYRQDVAGKRESFRAASEVIYLPLTPDYQNPVDDRSAWLTFERIVKLVGKV